MLSLGIVACVGRLLFMGAGCHLWGLGIICGAWVLFVGAGCCLWASLVGAGTFVGCGAPSHVVHILLLCGIIVGHGVIVGCHVIGVIVGHVMFKPRNDNE